MVIRLRQIALVAADLAAAEADIRAVLGVAYAYDDPGVGKYGLKNAVFPIGESFLEVVSPKQDGTTAGRLIDKRGGDGGYMVILQTDDLSAARDRIAGAGARVADQRDHNGASFTHIHPKDIGGAILSVDAMEPWQRWEWGGPVWRDHVDTRVTTGIVGAEVQAENPTAMAARWAEVLGLVARENVIALDEGEIRFIPIRDGRGEGVGGFDVAVHDPAAVRAAAEARGCVDAEGIVLLAGTRVHLAGA